MAELDLEIRKEIRRYLDAKIGAEDLEAWLSAETVDAQGPTHDLALEAMRLVAEYTGDAGTDDVELRERLGVLSRAYWFWRAPKTVISDSAARFIVQAQPSALKEHVEPVKSLLVGLKERLHDQVDAAIFPFEKHREDSDLRSFC